MSINHLFISLLRWTISRISLPQCINQFEGVQLRNILALCFYYQICLVLGSVVAVIIYRVIAREDLFKERGATGPLLASVTSTFINTLSIMIMGKVCKSLRPCHQARLFFIFQEVYWLKINERHGVGIVRYPSSPKKDSATETMTLNLTL